MYKDECQSSGFFVVCKNCIYSHVSPLCYADCPFTAEVENLRVGHAFSDAIRLYSSTGCKVRHTDEAIGWMGSERDPERYCRQSGVIGCKIEGEGVCIRSIGTGSRIRV